MPLTKRMDKPASRSKNAGLKTAVKKPMSDAQLAKWEAGRDLEAGLAQSVREMARGEGSVVFPPAIAARQNSKLSQAQFARLLGVSVRTLQGWEQGRKQPSGAARTLITLAQRNPKALRDLADA